MTARASSRRPIKTADSKSAAEFEALVIDGEQYVVKWLSDDWLAAAARDTSMRAIGLWECGVYAALDDLVDSAVVSATREATGGPTTNALLMRDVTDCLVAVDGAVDIATHDAFVTAMAAVHARCWEAVPVADLMDFAVTYDLLSPRQAAIEAGQLGDRSEVLRRVRPAWAALTRHDPELMAIVQPLLADPSPLVTALARTPVTFVHGDWKMGNLGRRPDGRVVLLDWDRPAAGPGAADLAWYLAVNSDRLPESKNAACRRYREALERHGIVTGEWWHVQLPLALLGAFLQLGWGKVGQPEELAWWREQVMAADAQLRAEA